MLNALARFNASVAEIKGLGLLFDYLDNHVPSPMSYMDILRFQLVYGVSALDKLMHDLIRVGMVDQFTGSRPQTPKFSSEKISIALHKSLSTPGLIPAQFYFEQDISVRHKLMSFQDPDKISDALSFIWNEPHKWQKIAKAMGSPEADVKTRLKLIVGRRNAIVHEADTDPMIGLRNVVTSYEAAEITEFIESLGNAICGEVL